MQPRILRFRDAPSYLGMDRNRFNAEVRPYLTEIPIGKQGIGFDRLELDAWVDDYKSPQRASRTRKERYFHFPHLSRLDDFVANCVSNECSGGGKVELSHHRRPVRLNGLLADAKQCGHLLVGMTLGNQLNDLALREVQNQAFTTRPCGE